MAALLRPSSSGCSSPKFLLHSRGSSSSSPSSLLMLLHSLCSAPSPSPSKSSCFAPPRDYQHHLRALQHQAPNSIFRTSVLHRSFYGVVRHLHLDREEKQKRSITTCTVSASDAKPCASQIQKLLLQLEFSRCRSRLYHALQGTKPGQDHGVAYEDVYTMENLRTAYGKLHRTVSPGIDGRARTPLTERGLERLKEELRKQTYAPKPSQRIILPTPEGGRPLSIASTIDKVVQTAVVMVLEPAFEPIFRNSSHGFRSGRSCHTCLRALRSTWLGMSWMVQIDLQKLFTKAHHAILLELMSPILHSKSFEDLIRKLLNAGYVDIYNLTDRTQYNTELVMGSIFSPLCNNILLHELDCYVEDELIPMFEAGEMSPPEDNQGPKKLKYLRYADNILIGLKGSKQDGIAIRTAVQIFLQQKLKFDINEQTSPVLNARSDMAKFLGALIHYG